MNRSFLRARLHATRQSSIWVALTTTALLLGAATSHASSDLEGTWLLSKPQTLLVPADGSPVPFTDAGRKTYEQNRASARRGDFSFDLTMQRCSSPGVPRLMFSPRRFKLFSRPGKVMFLFE